MRFVHRYASASTYNEERQNKYLEPWVSYTDETEEIHFNKTEYEKLLETPLTFEILSDGDIRWCAGTAASTPKTIEYKKNDGEWVSITSASGNSAPAISVVAGDIVQFKGDNQQYGSRVNDYNCFSGTSCGFKTYGNIMSLIDSTDFATLTTLASSYTFFRLFTNCAGLTDAHKLILPANTLSPACYDNLFAYCNGLVSAPELPTTTLGDSCYYGMFYNCTSLVTAPELPATTLVGSCYYGMFQGCTSLVTAPELPATTLVSSCYQSMFSSCTGLTTAPELPATTLAQSCYSRMFNGCTSLVTAPELPATTLAQNCYYRMFYGCSNLNHIKAMFTSGSSSSLEYDLSAYTNNWVYGVASTGTFVKNSAATWNETGVNGIPTGWDVQTASE